MNCAYCGKTVNPKNGAVLSPLTTNGKDTRYYCNWECLLNKLDETLRDSRKIIEKLKEVIK